jgi:ribosomal-protein-alanine N-acetyltransferase
VLKDKKFQMETDRLIIRPFTYQDQDSIYQVMKDKEMCEYTPDEPWESMEDAKYFVKQALWLYDLNHYTFRHFFAITRRGTDEIIGFCGVGGIGYDRNENEIFYSIGKAYWGKGYATEAATAVLKYAFDRLNLENIIGVVHPENIASRKVMEKIGLKKVGIIHGLPAEHSFFNGEYLYSLSRDEYILQSSLKGTAII